MLPPSVPHSRYCLILCLISLLAMFLGCQEMNTPKAGGVAPSISCNNVLGEYFQLSQLKNSVVVLYFWSSKCCGDSLKRVQPFYDQQRHRGVSVVAIEVGGSKESVASYVKGVGLTFTNLTDEYGTISKSYQVVGYPTVFIIDKQGVVQKKVSGEIGSDQLAKVVAPFL